MMWESTEGEEGEHGPCKQCGATNILFFDEEHVWKCVECGLVAEDAEVFSKQETFRERAARFSLTTSSSWSKNIPRLRRPATLHQEPNFTFLTNICTTLGFKNQVREQMKELLRQVSEGKRKNGRSGEILSAAVAYIVCRQSKLPVTLADVSRAIQCDVFRVGAVFTKLVQKHNITVETVDPALFIERMCSTLELDVHDKKRFVLQKKAIALVNVMTRDWLRTGRAPLPLSYGALSVALEASGMSWDLEEGAKKLGLSSYTTTQRMKELRKRLIQIGQTELPFGASVKLRTLPMYLRQIVDFVFVQHMIERSEDEASEGASGLEESGGSESAQEGSPRGARGTPECNPPSFVQSHIAKEKRIEMLVRAKWRIYDIAKSCKRDDLLLHTIPRRLQQRPSEDRLAEVDVTSSGEQDGDDEVIRLQEALCSGVPDEALISGYYTSAPSREGTGTAAHDDDHNTVQDITIQEYLCTPEEVSQKIEIDLLGKREFEGCDEPHSKRVKRE